MDDKEKAESLRDLKYWATASLGVVCSYCGDPNVVSSIENLVEPAKHFCNKCYENIVWVDAAIKEQPMDGDVDNAGTKVVVRRPQNFLDDKYCHVCGKSAVVIIDREDAVKTEDGYLDLQINLCQNCKDELVEKLAMK